MIDVFTPKTISPDYLFKSNHRQVKNSILFPRCAIYLCGMLHTTDFAQRSSPRYVGHRGDRLRGVLHTAEIISTICCTQQRWSLRYDEHQGNHLCGVVYTAEMISAVWCTDWGDRFVIEYLGEIETEFENTLGCLGAQMVLNHEKIGVTNLVTYSL